MAARVQRPTLSLLLLFFSLCLLLFPLAAVRLTFVRFRIGRGSLLIRGHRRI